MWRKFMDEIKGTSRSTKLMLVAVLIICAASSMLLVSCGVVTPNKDYVQRMDKRAELHMPRYKALIDGATKAQLEQITGQAKGTYSSLSDRQVRKLKDRLMSEVDGWHEVIKENAKLIQDKENGGDK